MSTMTTLVKTLMLSKGDELTHVEVIKRGFENHGCHNFYLSMDDIDLVVFNMTDKHQNVLSLVNKLEQLYLTKQNHK